MSGMGSCLARMERPEALPAGGSSRETPMVIAVASAGPVPVRRGGIVNLKYLLRATALVAVVMTVGLFAGPARADVWTDKTVYQAGETVAISGNQMQPGESVGVDVSLPGGSLAQHHDVLADGQGNFSDSYTLPSDAPSGDYTVVATGADSGNTF